ncbi:MULTISPECIES: hypothetical protein [unclassified Pseudomonas]|uniref:hypothetical protein n=1 Tax=unclassified Pseudomonas TaxID=196821 RepID=UPI0024494754|nr:MULTISPECIES: hypothetical protein [unclassified Pseudomonas]MDH0301836.1 hypothetical protein [Pseudomonas sp. GD04091]MDH1983876.1 hypothetical protein [Pseudomonas sp. GD03689]
MRKLFGLAALVMLAGCSTTPVSEDHARQIPADRIYDQALMKPVSKDESTVTFLRDEGFYGSGCSHVVYVNNRKAFAIRSGEGVRIHLAPGSYFFRLETGAGMCPNIATSQNSELKPGAHETYRILLPSDGSLRLTRIQ